MEYNRLPRFNSAPAVAPMQLTERDRAIIQWVREHRLLRSSHLVSLAGGSQQQVLRRLQLLYHHGFLERPRTQIEFYYQGGSRSIVYGLGKEGASLLNQTARGKSPFLRSGGKPPSVGRLFFEHTLFVSDIMVGLELACRKAEGIRLLAGEELPITGGGQKTFKLRVKVNSQVSLGIIPDRVFALASDDESPDRSPTVYFLEADRGTMPIVRTNLSQTSFYRKLLAYQAAWSQGLHRSQCGIHRFRVLTVTTSAERVESMIAACSQLKSGHGLFLFCDWSALQHHGDMLSAPWQTGRRGEAASLLP